MLKTAKSAVFALHHLTRRIFSLHLELWKLLLLNIQKLCIFSVSKDDIRDNAKMQQNSKCKMQIEISLNLMRSYFFEEKIYK